MALEQIQLQGQCGKIHDVLNSKQVWKEGGCESGIGLHGLINGLNCFEEFTIAHAKHCRPRVSEILSLLIKWKMQMER